MNLKSSLLALLGVSTIGGGVTGGYYLLRPNKTTINKEDSNSKTSDSKSTTSSGSSEVQNHQERPPASPSEGGQRVTSNQLTNSAADRASQPASVGVEGAEISTTRTDS